MSENNGIYFCSATDPVPTLWTVTSIIVIILNFLASLGCFFFIGSILSTKDAYTNTFNLYVTFLLLPDALNTLLQGIFGIFQAVNCGGCPIPFLFVYEGIQFFYFFCNFYLNVVVAYEIYSILERSSIRMRTGPPPMRKTLFQIASVNFFALLFSIWGGLNVPWSFHYRGEGGLFSELGTMILFVSLMFIPIMYVVAIRIRIWKKNLLPKEGKTKGISIFFMRIIVVFFGFYIPNATLTQVVQTLGTYLDPAYFWMERFLHLLHALQAIVTLYMVAFKEDIRSAVVSKSRRLSRFSKILTMTTTDFTSLDARKSARNSAIAVQSPTAARTSTDMVENSTSERNNDDEETGDHLNGSKKIISETRDSSDVEGQLLHDAISRKQSFEDSASNVKY